MIRIVGIGEYVITRNQEDIVKTFALASCVAMTVYCPIGKVLGMVHIVLSDSSINTGIEKERIGYYADIAVPFLINKMCFEHGCNKSQLSIHIFGGAESSYKGDVFNIGKRNIETIKAILDRFGVSYNIDSVGGNNSRTIEMYVATGSFKIYEQPIRI